MAGTVGNEESVEDEVREAHTVYRSSPLEIAANLEATAEPNITMIPVAAVRKEECSRTRTEVGRYCRNQTRAAGGLV